MDLRIPKIFSFLLEQKSRYKAVYGGRGGAKSESIARAILILALNPRILFDKDSIRILCCREYQSSIADSVHRLLVDIIKKYELFDYFTITKTNILSSNGSLFIFKGISNDPQQLKSTVGIDLCFVEEAEKVSSISWDYLTPTIRNPNSEIWVGFNPNQREDPTYQMFVENPLPDSICVKVNYYDNPYFEDTPLLKEMLYDKENNPELYQNKWEGNIKQISDAIIFKDKFVYKDFETPKNIFQNRFFYGIDWGFSNDPLAIIRCCISDNELYIDYEAGGIGIEMEQYAGLIDTVPDSKKWIIYADNARPESISYVRRQGYNISACEKGKGSVEDGIAYLRDFKMINIHTRCKQLYNEMCLYSYKVDRITNEPLITPVDKYNHYIDALRYSLSPYIKKQAKIQLLY